MALKQRLDIASHTLYVGDDEVWLNTQDSMNDHEGIYLGETLEEAAATLLNAATVVGGLAIAQADERLNPQH
jgi:hypothetical protein